MKVYYDESPAGAGKTERAIESITRSKCKALFVTERKESFPELRSRLKDASQKMGSCPIVRHIHGEMVNPAGSVVKEVEFLPLRHSGLDHVIVIMTHAALLQSDFGGFNGWRIVIDEVPPFLDFEEKATHLDKAYFERHYSLQSIDGIWHAVEPTLAGLALSSADVRADDSHKHLAVFHARVLESSRRAANRHVLCNLHDWAAMEDRRVKWSWASTFSLRELAAFDRVELLGNRFRSNIGSRLAEFFDGEDVEWVELPPLATKRQFVSRSVHIHFFSDRPAAKSLFESREGQVALREIGRHLKKVLPAGNSIWSANDTAGRGQPTPKQALDLPPADYLTPKQAGTNRYASLSHAAIIYAAKPCSNLRSLLNVCGIDPDHWTQSIEHEAILQFVTRTSVRDPGNSTPVHVYVFDQAQADYLMGYFGTLPHVDADVSQVHLPIEIPPKSKGGRPAAVRTPQEQARWAEDERRKDRERKRAARAKKSVA